MPAAHTAQAEAPAAPLKEPLGQGAQEELAADAEKLPAAQAEADVAPVALTYEPAAASLQEVAADSAANVPVAHSVQGSKLPSRGCCEPGLQA